MGRDAAELFFSPRYLHLADDETSPLGQMTTNHVSSSALIDGGIDRVARRGNRSGSLPAGDMEGGKRRWKV